VDRLFGRKSRAGAGVALGAAAFGVASAAALLAATYRPDQDVPEPAASETAEKDDEVS
jgi:hypothetical protein